MQSGGTFRSSPLNLKNWPAGLILRGVGRAGPGDIGGVPGEGFGRKFRENRAANVESSFRYRAIPEAWRSKGGPRRSKGVGVGRESQENRAEHLHKRRSREQQCMQLGGTFRSSPLDLRNLPAGLILRGVGRAGPGDLLGAPGAGFGRRSRENRAANFQPECLQVPSPPSEEPGCTYVGQRAGPGDLGGRLRPGIRGEPGRKFP